MLPRFILLLTMCACTQLAAKDHVALLGTYTGGESRGIYSVRLNPDTGALSTPELAAELSNPEFLALHPSGRFVYALTQVPAEGGKNTAAVAAFQVDAATARLSLLNTEATGRSSLTHLAVGGNGRMIVAASYGGAYVVSFPLSTDGHVGSHASLISQEGPLGPNHARQDAAHPHSVTISPDSRFAFVADLGIDRVFTYQLKPENGSIAPNDPAYATFEPGTGPRHTKFSPDGKFFYVLDELDSTITSCRYEPASGLVQPFQRVSALPEDFTGKSTSSELRIHPSGRYVYSANRGHNSIAVFSRDPTSGALTRVEIVPSGGETPRNFSLTPDGAWLLCAHQATNNLTVFKVSADSGRLTATPHTAHVPKCVCVLFLQ